MAGTTILIPSDPNYVAAGGALASPLTAPNGSATAPSYAFTASPTTGIYSPGSGQLAISQSGVQALLFSGSQLATFAGNLTSNGTKAILNSSVLTVGTGTPQGSVTGSPGDMFRRTDGGIGTACYVKSTGSATNTGWSPIPTNFGILGANDSEIAAAGCAYWHDHMFEGAASLYATYVSGTNNSAGGGYAGPRSDDSNTINTASVDTNNHPGVMGVFSQAVGYSCANRLSALAWAPNTGVTTVIRILFRTPAAVSDNTNDYTLYVGAVAAGASTNAQRGWFAKYRHSTNSGNWQCGSVNTNISGEVLTNSSLAFSANTWQTLTITLPASGSNVAFSITVGGVTTSLGTVANTAMEAPTQQGITQIAGLILARNASDGTTYRAAYIDRVALYSSGMTGQGN